MADKTSIEWTDATWNPVRGCSIVSKGCTNCYAMRQAHRSHGAGGAYEGLTKLTKGGPVWTGEVRLVPELLEQPLKWQRPRRIFVNSMSDLFHENVPDSFIDQVFGVMGECDDGGTVHTFQVLTKRPQRMLAYISARGREAWNARRMNRKAWPARNVWLGVSVEDQAAADERIPLLLQTPAAVRWISAEPLLGPINLRSIEVNRGINDGPLKSVNHLSEHDALSGDSISNLGFGYSGGPKIDWVVAGGESGPGARPMQPEWARLLRDQCAAVQTAFFFKQWGAWAPPIAEDGVPPGALEGRLYRVGKKAAGRELDGRTHDEYPA